MAGAQAKEKKSRYPCKIIDDDGNDVTPKILTYNYYRDPSATFKLGTGAVSSYEHLEAAGQKSITKSVFDWSLIDALGIKTFHKEKPKTISKILPKRRLKSRLQLGSLLILTETETIWHFELDEKSVMKENEDDFAKVIEENNMYADVLRRHEGSKGLINIGVQTYNYFYKNKSQQTDSVDNKSVGTIVSLWLLAEAKEEQEKLARTEASSHISSNEGLPFVEVEKMIASKPSSKPKDLSNFPNFMESVLLTYRALNANTNKRIWGTLKGYQPFDLAEASGASLEDEPPFMLESEVSLVINPLIKKLVVLYDEIVNDYSASCIAWSPADPNIFAVGYIHQSKFKAYKGIILCWSIKNCEYPERIFYAHTGVTALEFSKTTPLFLAAGMFNGIVALYDVQATDHQPLDDNLDSHNRTNGTIWQIRWMAGDPSDGKMAKESFVTCADDGYITNWSIGDGLHGILVMHLKRTVVGGSGHEEYLLSRFAQGFSLDFKPDDKDVYIVGTDEGLVHKCSPSYSEQYLKSYHYHKTPIYGVRFSPWAPSIFACCCGDWTITVWNIESSVPSVAMQSLAKSAILGIDWSSQSATVFACFTDQTMEIWDLAYSLVEPIAHMAPAKESNFTCVGFSPMHNAVATGDNNGRVSLACLFNMTAPKKAADLIKATASKDQINEAEEEIDQS